MVDARDPVGSSFFALEIDGLEVAWFQGLDGPSTRSEVYEIVEGGVNDRVHAFPGKATWAPLVLRHATHASAALWDWREACLRDPAAPVRSGAVSLLAADGRVVRRYELVGMWPLRWSGPELDADGSALAIETLEIAVDAVRLG